MQKGGFVYIITNKNKTVLYVGVTSNLKSRIWEHEHHEFDKSFTNKYNLEFLIYYEWYDNIERAIEREKQLKRWTRDKKEYIINLKNKDWRFLNDEIYNEVYSLLY